MDLATPRSTLETIYQKGAVDKVLIMRAHNRIKTIKNTRYLIASIFIFASFLLNAYNVKAENDLYIRNDIMFYSEKDDCVSSSSYSSDDPLPDSIPAVWKDLIEMTASRTDEYPEFATVDKRAVATVLWIENRGWPEFKTSGWATSHAGAGGPFQFIPSTWSYFISRGWNLDGDGDGKMDRNNPKDAVVAAFYHLLDTKGKPIVDGYTGNPEQDYNSAIFKDDINTSILASIRRYNGRGARANVTIKAQPFNENGTYVKYAYWLLATNFQKTLKTGTNEELKEISNDINGDGSQTGDFTLGNNCEPSSNISEGGLTEDQAKKFMMRYGENVNNSVSSLIGEYWNKCNGGGSNCVSFSYFFNHAFDSDTKMAKGAVGDGNAVVGNMKANGSDGGTEPKLFSTFSWSNGGYGHTGIVLGIHGDQIIVGHASCSSSGIGKGDGTKEGGGSGFVLTGNINDAKAFWGTKPTGFAYPSNIDVAKIQKFIDTGDL